MNEIYNPNKNLNQGYDSESSIEISEISNYEFDPEVLSICSKYNSNLKRLLVLELQAKGLSLNDTSLVGKYTQKYMDFKKAAIFRKKEYNKIKFKEETIHSDNQKNYFNNLPNIQFEPPIN